MTGVAVLRWTRRALGRLDSIGDHIARDNSAAAKRVVARIVSAAEHLKANPALGRAGRIGGTRELVLGDIPYIVAYRVADADIEILTILHTSQEWPEAL
ncbi:type II toxin-antitoxin system RelE/ParE family toxin [Labrys sp. La1]